MRFTYLLGTTSPTVYSRAFLGFNIINLQPLANFFLTKPFYTAGDLIT
jgi:hypothetical protein